MSLQNNGKQLNPLSYGITSKSTQRQYDPNSNDSIYNTTCKTILRESNNFHDQTKTPNPISNRNFFSYFSSYGTADLCSNTVADCTYTTNSKSNNTVQEATDDST